IPIEWRATACLSARDLLAALDEVARFEAFLVASACPDAGEERLGVRLTFSTSGGSVALETVASKEVPTPVQWRLRANIPAYMEGPDKSTSLSISLNRCFLRECLQAMAIAPRERVEMRFNSPVSPILVRPKGDESRFTLIMPFRPL